MLRFLRIILPLVSMAVIAPSLEAQTVSEGRIINLTEEGLFKNLAGEPCGPYFRYSGKPANPTKVGVVTFVYTVPTGNVESYAIINFGTDKFEVIVTPRLKNPTAKVLSAGGPPPWIVVRISPEDLEKAPCLPRPSGPRT